MLHHEVAPSDASAAAACPPTVWGPRVPFLACPSFQRRWAVVTDLNAVGMDLVVDAVLPAGTVVAVQFRSDDRSQTGVRLGRITSARPHVGGYWILRCTHLERPSSEDLDRLSEYRQLAGMWWNMSDSSEDLLLPAGQG
jgi:hypothetical protein